MKILPYTKPTTQPKTARVLPSPGQTGAWDNPITAQKSPRDIIQDALDAVVTESVVCETAWHKAAPGTSAESIAWGQHRFAQGYVVGLRVALALYDGDQS